MEKFCLVTGTSTGIGYHVAQSLLSAGWHVLGVSRRAGALQHPRYRHVRLDLGDISAVQSYFESVFPNEVNLSTFSRVGLVNNAALLSPVGPIDTVDLEALELAFRVNTVVPAWLMGYFKRASAHAHLRILNVSSGAAHRPTAGWTAYCGTKAALRMASQVLAAEWAEIPRPASPAGTLAVCCFEPGVVDTPMQDEVRRQNPENFPRVQRFLELKAAGQLIPPEKPALAMARWLDSDPAEVFTETRFQG